MEKNLQTWFATILGAVLLLVGIIGFFNDPVLGLFPVNGLHNVVHLLSGAIGIWAGVWGGINAARWFNRVFGIIYAVVAILGFVAPGVAASLLEIDAADNWLHVLIAVASLVVGFWKTETAA
jgi:hypothetical protein